MRNRKSVDIVWFRHLQVLFVFIFSSYLSCASAFAQSGNNIPTSPGPDFDIGTLLSNYSSSGGAQLYLTQLDNNLMGESHDIDTGALTFRQVDVSLPGNNNLHVEFARRANGKSHLQENGLMMTALGYVWDVDLPYVITRVDQGKSGNCDVVVEENERFSSYISATSLAYWDQDLHAGGWRARSRYWNISSPVRLF